MRKFLDLTDYLKFIPLLFIYLIICLIKSQDILVGDEDDYLRYANNLLNGFYAHASHDYDFLWNGPGYPIFLTVFEYFDSSLLSIKLFNCLFIYFGIILFFKSLKLFISEKKALYVTLTLGLYYPFLVQSIPFVLTEAMSFFLVSSFSFNFLSYINSNSRKSFWLAVLTLGYLVLTKIIFAYVILSLIIVFIPFLFFKKSIAYSKKYILVLVLSFCFTTPYLIYTYSLTDKLFYYGDSGGMSLYWMSTPYENEFGDWHSFVTLKEKPELYKNHHSFINSIKDLHPVEKDIALKEKAINNIKSNKVKFLKNWQFNLSRLFFNHPYSTYNEPPDSILMIYLFNGILLFLLIITTLLSIKHINSIDSIFYFFASFILIYLGGVSLLSAYPRFLHIVLPVILIWIGYVLNEFVTIQLKSPN